MKGVIVAGGLGTRLRPLTHITNKHLLPVYDKPMILYPLDTLARAGVEDIIIVCGREHAGHFMQFLGSGKAYGVRLSYAIQDTNDGGIADALSYAKDFADGHPLALILGDNIFEMDFSKSVTAFKKIGTGASVFLKKVPDPERFGVADIKGGRVRAILEKPKRPPSDLAVTGFYLYGPEVFVKLKKLKPSTRGQLEITDVHNLYIADNALMFGTVKGFWSDAGTFESLHRSAMWARGHLRRPAT